MEKKRGRLDIDFTADLGIAPRASDDDSLFARDIDGQLIRVEKATEADFSQDVSLTVDGREITVKKAVPQLDANGTVLRDGTGKPELRFTTIYDAAAEAFVRSPGDEHPIPTLCHREHLPPIGVCRVCIVEAAEGGSRSRRKLVPACIQRVSEGMVVNTFNSPVDEESAARVRAAASTVTELLIADHLPPTAREDDGSSNGNELAAIAHRFGIKESRFQSNRTDLRDKKDHSKQHMIAVDHNQCIMCGRCMRGCNWVKNNRVIGRSGKGYATLIAFDLDTPMHESSCVECGECAISCPTGALVFEPDYIHRLQGIEQKNNQDEGRSGNVLEAEELSQIPLFSGIPLKFLQFNAASVTRRDLKAGETLCEEGEYGATAFVILKGKFEIFLSNRRGAIRTEKAGGIKGFFGGLVTRATQVGGKARLGDVGASPLQEDERIFRDESDVILGEMTCMNRYPRSATVVAVIDCEVLEIRRNVLHMLQRNEVSREILNNAYRSRSLAGQLEELRFLSELDEQSRSQAIAFLKPRVDLILVDPGQVIFEQGDDADSFYIVKLGFVKVSTRMGQDEKVLNYLGPGSSFGEIGLLSEINEDIANTLVQDERKGKRTATCRALDHVELIRIAGRDFHQLLVTVPELREQLEAQANKIMENDRVAVERLNHANEEDFFTQGLVGGQKLLVLDLERCTRCDECTKACADTHEGVTRLVREGLRFDKYLIASACRSCMDPYCLVGCPVDAIHRDGGSLEIEIEDYCIGCGLCASNCPYGNINMHELPKLEVKGKKIKKTASVQRRATTCDLCRSIDGQPSCVYACPHNAAFRWSGEELLNIVEKDGKAFLGAD